MASNKQVRIEFQVGGVKTLLDAVRASEKAISDVGTAAKITGQKMEILGVQWSDTGSKIDLAVKGIEEFPDAAKAAEKAIIALIAAAQAGGIAMEDLSLKWSNASETTQKSQKQGGLGGLSGLLGGNLAQANGLISQLGKVTMGVVVAFGIVTAATLAWKTALFALNAVLSILNFTLNLFSKFIGLIISGIRGIIGAGIGIVVKAFKTLGDVLKIASGFLLGRAFEKIAFELRELAASTFEAVGEFQKLNIQFAALQARDISRTTGKPLVDVMKQAEEQARGLLLWVQKLAVQTPFTVRQISETLALANAYELTTGESQLLTKATIDFASAMGLTEDHIYRIIYNFGQMKTQGKLTGREFRDLAVSFVPVWDILGDMGKEAGKTTEEMRQLAFKGGVPVEEFFRRFIALVERDFPDAAKKMSRTLTGVTGNIKDFFQSIIGFEVLGPSGDVIAGRLADMLDNLLKTAIAPAHKLGELLGDALNGILLTIEQQLVPAIKEMAEAFGIGQFSWEKFYLSIAAGVLLLQRGITALSQKISEWAKGVATTFDSLSSNGHSWGYNLMMSFAQGMGTAIAAVVRVITSIVNLIAGWFKPGSPPKIAPLIDKWGAATMTEWMKGWLLADFGIFNDIADKVQSYIESIAYRFKETQIIPMILGSREAIAKAINAVRDGILTVGEAAQNIFKKVKVISKEFKAYIISLFEVEGLTRKVADAEKIVEERQKAVAQAAERVKFAQAAVEEIEVRRKKIQDEINSTSDYYNKIIAELRKELEKVTEEYSEQQRLKEIDQAIGTGLLTQSEKERLAMEKRSIELNQQIRSTEETRDAALEELNAKIALVEAEKDAAEQRVEAAQAEEAAAEARVAQAEIAVDAAQKELDIAKERLDTAEALIDAQIDQNNLIQEQFELLKRLAEQAAAAAEQETVGEGGSLGGGFPLPQPEDVSLWLENLFQEAGKEGGLADQWASDITAIFTTAIGQADWEGLSKAWQNLIGTKSIAGSGFSALLTDLKDFWKTLTTGKIDADTDDFFLRMTRPAQGTTAEQLAISLREIATALGNVAWSAVTEGINALSLAIQDVDWVKLTDSINSIADGVNKFATSLSDIQEVGFTEWVLELIGDSGPLGKFIATLDRLGLAWSKIYIFIQLLIPRILGFIIAAFGTWGEQLIEQFEEIWANLKQTVINWWNEMVKNSIIPEMMQDIYDAITSIFQDILDWINNTFIAPVQTSFENMADYLIGENGVITVWVKNTYDTVTKKLDELFNWIDSTFIDPVEKLFDGLRDYLVAEPDGLIPKAAQAIYDLFIKPVQDLVKDINTVLFGEPDGLVAKFRNAIDTIKGFFSPTGAFATAVNWFKEHVIDPLLDAIQTLIDAYKTIRGIKSDKDEDGQGALGIIARPRRSYLVGENGPEIFTPGYTGRVQTNAVYNALRSMAMQQVAGAQAYAPGYVDNSVHIEVNPTYKNVQSEASLYYDLTAALAAARR